MSTRYFTIAGGNATALVVDAPQTEHLQIAHELLQTVEQVGFISLSPRPTLTMMGGELCINALLAFAHMLPWAIGTLSVHGTSVDYIKSDRTVTVTLSLPHTRDNNTILFDTIGYLVTESTEIFAIDFFAAKAAQYHLPAFGVIQTQADGSILPHVYVRDTASLVTESACGSGSLAVSIITGATDITQPTGQAISIQTQKLTTYSISAHVVEYTR